VKRLAVETETELYPRIPRGVAYLYSVQYVTAQHYGSDAFNSVNFFALIIEPHIVGVTGIEHRKIYLGYDRGFVSVHGCGYLIIVDGKTHVPDLEAQSIEPRLREVVGQREILLYLFPGKVCPKIAGLPGRGQTHVIAVEAVRYALLLVAVQNMV
jgi:hypothetical protein